MNDQRGVRRELWAAAQSGAEARASHSSLFSRHPSASGGGFTFAELLAAMVFVAILIPAAMHGLAIANRAGVVADHKRVAAALADKLLNETIVTEDWRHGDQTGDFGEEWPGYRWAVQSEGWDVDTMEVVSVEVFYEVQGVQYSVRLSTLAKETEE